MSCDRYIYVKILMLPLLEGVFMALYVVTVHMNS